MDERIEKLDWTYIRAFLAVAETGSLSAAARRTGQSQPTLGRHIKAAEAVLRAELFTRVPTGLELTETGRILLGPAEEMACASAKLMTLAAGHDMGLAGVVRITASVVVSHYILPRIIADIRALEPDIQIELVPSDTTENLMYREADIAVRMFRPTQLDVVARKLGEQDMALYTAPALLDTHGQPETLSDLVKMPFVGFDRSDLIIRTMRGFGVHVTREDFPVRCDNQASYWELVRAGCGVGAMQTVIADGDPSVVRLDLQPELPKLPIWLAAHEVLLQTPRVRRVWALLADGLSALNSRG